MDPRRRARRFALALLPALALAACDWSTEPVSLSLEFPQASTLNADGTCRVQFVANAYGYGSAEWTRVTVRQGDVVTADYAGAETAEFWGQRGISAGGQLTSAAFTAPDAGRDVVIDVRYQVTGPERSVTLRPECAATAAA